METRSGIAMLEEVRYLLASCINKATWMEGKPMSHNKIRKFKNIEVLQKTIEVITQVMRSEITYPENKTD
jgi:hypothetical protein